MYYTENKEPRPLSEFDMKEIYRLVRNERIPGFVMLGKERDYLDEYRQALAREMENQNELNQAKTAPVEETPAQAEAEAEADVEIAETQKKRKSSRKKKQNIEES